MDTYVGFDSAWTDNAKAPGAICAIQIEPSGSSVFYPPQLVSFSGALDFTFGVQSSNGVTLIALDQPTRVPNIYGKRPVEGAASPLMGWLGGAIQPSNRERKGMFCDASPIWPFLTELQAVEKPEEARAARTGRYLIEVFPALALPSLSEEFFGRLRAPKYNPGRKTFKVSDWRRVSEVVAGLLDAMDLSAASRWCLEAAEVEKPRKALQDKLDAIVCLYIALSWRIKDRSESMILGGSDSGYIVLPASPAVRERLELDAAERGVPVDRWVD